MNIVMNPWLVAVLIEAVLLSSLVALYFWRRVGSMDEESRLRLLAVEERLEDAKQEARRIEEEAARKRKIVTFETADIDALVADGKMAGDPEVLEKLKVRVKETTDVLDGMTASVSRVSAAVGETMDKQMEAVTMVGRLGGTAGLPPEIKEKAEAILDVFRTMDEVLSGAYEEVDKLESGLGEVNAVVSEFSEADPTVALPDAEMLNACLKAKTGEADSAEAPTPAEGGEEPPLDAFDTAPEEEIRV
ncbi:MAG: hypothetical protein AAFU79_17700 [Myxococcota bacterium]